MKLHFAAIVGGLWGGGVAWLAALGGPARAGGLYLPERALLFWEGISGCDDLDAKN